MLPAGHWYPILQLVHSSFPSVNIYDMFAEGMDGGQAASSSSLSVPVSRWDHEFPSYKLEGELPFSAHYFSCPANNDISFSSPPPPARSAGFLSSIHSSGNGEENCITFERAMILPMWNGSGCNLGFLFSYYHPIRVRFSQRSYNFDPTTLRLLPSVRWSKSWFSNWWSIKAASVLGSWILCTTIHTLFGKAIRREWTDQIETRRSA